MASSLFVAAEEVHRELPVDPLVYGTLAFGLLMLMMLALLMFGKGRPHS